MDSYRVVGLLPQLQKHTHFRYNNHEVQASYSSWPFPFLEDLMNPIPLAAAILVKTVLEWWLED